MTFVAGLVVAMICGGCIGVAYDRYSRRADPPPRPARDTRHLHVIEDEWHTPDVRVHDEET